MKYGTQFHRGRQRGTAALELALVALFALMPMVIVIGQAGKALSEYNTLVKSVRDATRYLTLHDLTLNASGPLDAARCLAKYGNVQVAANGTATCAGTLLLPNLATATVNITHASVAAAGVGTIQLVTVKITGYKYAAWEQSFIPGITDITFSPISNTMRGLL
jgi:Flp pilus assembly protein TadG